jgi:hypothetical protein
MSNLLKFLLKYFNKNINKPLKMYIIVRKDLDATYRCVQGGHAVAQFAIDHIEKFKEWNNKTIVYLGVNNEYVMQLLENKLINSGKLFSWFIEPDLHNALTSIACVDTGEIFKDLKII